jgi:hypothetical protein
MATVSAEVAMRRRMVAAESAAARLERMVKDAEEHVRAAAGTRRGGEG